MTEDNLHAHLPMFHCTQPNPKELVRCTICGITQRNIAVHVFNFHGPPGRGEVPNEDQLSLSKCTYTFCLAVVRNKAGKFLLVQEVANWGWWLPGGRLNRGEDLIAAVVRETKEEAGIDIRVTGLLRLEYSPHLDAARMRAIFLAEPISEEQEPKTEPNFESVAAAWVTTKQLEKLPLRGREPAMWFPYVENGGTIYPLDLLTHEGAPVRVPVVPDSDSD